MKVADWKYSEQRYNLKFKVTQVAKHKSIKESCSPISSLIEIFKDEMKCIGIPKGDYWFVIRNILD